MIIHIFNYLFPKIRRQIINGLHCHFICVNKETRQAAIVTKKPARHVSPVGCSDFHIFHKVTKSHPSPLRSLGP
jgi:hypothetical protein